MDVTSVALAETRSLTECSASPSAEFFYYMKLKIDSAQLKLGMFIHKLECSWMQHPFLRNRFLLTNPSDIQKILDAGISMVWIDTQRGEAPLPAPDLGSPIADGCGLNLSDETVDPTRTVSSDIEFARELCSSARKEVGRLYEEARVGKILELSHTAALVEEITESVRERPQALFSVVRLKTHDNYTYMHSVAVCALMIALAQKMGMEKDLVRMAGFAGLFHDLGKATIPLNILTKPDKLSDAEFKRIKDHPQAGAQLLRRSGADVLIQDVALHHHEKLDGSGYPHGLEADEISIFARMGAVCDVYDAVTSERSYKPAWDPLDAVTKMMSWKGHFDPIILNRFIDALGVADQLVDRTQLMDH